MASSACSGIAMLRQILQSRSRSSLFCNISLMPALSQIPRASLVPGRYYPSQRRLLTRPPHRAGAFSPRQWRSAESNPDESGSEQLEAETPENPKRTSSNLDKYEVKAFGARNEEIRQPFVYLKQEDNSLSQLLPTDEVLRQINHGTHYLEVVKEPIPGWELGPYPICKVHNKREALAEQRAREKAQKENRIITKQIELSWVITDHDLGHKLKNLARFLDSGYKVEILVAPKRHAKREATVEQAEAIVTRIKETAAERQAAAFKPAAGELLRTFRLWFQGKKPEKGGKK